MSRVRPYFVSDEQIVDSLTDTEKEQVLAAEADEPNRYRADIDTLTAALDGDTDVMDDESVRDVIATAGLKLPRESDVHQKAVSREVPGLDLQLTPFEDNGVHLSTYIDLDREYIVQIPNNATFDEDMAEAQTVMQHYETLREHKVPVVADLDLVIGDVGGEPAPLLVSSYNDALAEYNELPPAEQEQADETAEYIAETVCDLIDDGKISYAEGKRFWEQGVHSGHLRYDRERETCVVVDYGEPV